MLSTKQMLAEEDYHLYAVGTDGLIVLAKATDYDEVFIAPLNPTSDGGFNSVEKQQIMTLLHDYTDPTYHLYSISFPGDIPDYFELIV